MLRTHTAAEPRHVAALEPPPAIGDACLIERLMANLLANAIRHNVPAVMWSCPTYASAGRAVFRIANTAPVVHGCELSRIFEPFQRLQAHHTRAEARSVVSISSAATSSETASPGGGVGLGLAIVKAIADAHDAVLIARARPGGGLRITVEFPTALPSRVRWCGR